jgi:PleD family two-component response regulator
VCQRLLHRLRNTSHALASGSLIVTASLGLATHSEHTPYRGVAELIEAADRSVYVAKKSGRNRVVCDDTGHLIRTG